MPAVPSYEDVVKRQGSAEYECLSEPSVSCCERVGSPAKEKLRALALSTFSHWIDAEEITKEDIDMSFNLVGGNHHGSFFVQVERIAGEICLLSFERWRFFSASDSFTATVVSRSGIRS